MKATASPFLLCLAVLGLQLAPGLSAAPAAKPLDSLVYRGRWHRDYHFQATVLANRKVTMLTRAPGELEVVETEQGKRFHHGRFAVDRVQLLEKRPPHRVLDTFVVAVSDSATKRSFVLNQGDYIQWPEYYAALSWGKKGDVFLVREGSHFPAPSGAKRFRVALIEENSLVVSPAEIPMMRIRIPRAH
jgi:hypothetical protein